MGPEGPPTPSMLAGAIRNVKPDAPMEEGNAPRLRLVSCPVGSAVRLPLLIPPDPLSRTGGTSPVAISKKRARTLCTQREWELLSQSWNPELGRITPGRLRQKVQRARTLRDKYRDLARQQAGEARGKRAARSTRPAQSNQNTKLKAEIFDEALERFQSRLAQDE